MISLRSPAAADAVGTKLRPADPAERDFFFKGDAIRTAIVESKTNWDAKLL